MAGAAVSAAPAESMAPPRQRRAWRQLDGISLLRATYHRHRFAVHTHDTFVLGTNLRGHAECLVHRDVGVHPGTLVVVPPCEPHGGRRLGEEPWDYLAAYPTRQLMTEILRDVTGDPRAVPAFSELAIDDPDLVARFVAAHLAIFGDDDPVGAESAMIEALGALLERHATDGRCRPRCQRRPGAVARAIEYIDAALDEPLSLAEIASAGGYSRFHFLRVFKASTGVTPLAFVMHRRVCRARRLLRRGAPIAHAAYDAGFADQSHLTRWFKQIVGVTPGEYVRGVG